MTIIQKKDRGDVVQFVGSDQDGNATLFGEIELIDGKARLLTSGIVQIEELFGADNQADVWFYLGTPDDLSTFAVDDTIEVRIKAGADPTLFPAINLTYTVVAADLTEPNVEIAVSNKIVALLKADAVFKDQWTAQRIDGNSTVWIGSKNVAEWSERPNTGDFDVITTGTAVATRAFDKIVRRGKSTSLTKDPKDPRFGVLGITGTVSSSIESVGQLYVEELAKLPHPSTDLDMAVNGSGTPVVFEQLKLTTEDIFVEELRFFGSGNGIQFSKFLNIASLSNGILVEIKSNDDLLTLPVIFDTEDFKNKFALNGEWDLAIVSGTDQFLATFKLKSPFPIRHVGEFPTDDFVRVTIRDNLAAVATLELLLFGFTREI